MITKDQLKDFECPVCLKVPREPPVYQCKRGHCVCSACCDKVTDCPVCRIPLGKERIRCLMLEKLLPNMKHNCKNADQGCKMEDSKVILEAHEKDCQYQSFDCVDTRCIEKVSMMRLLEHVQKKHHGTFRWANKGCVEIKISQQKQEVTYCVPNSGVDVKTCFWAPQHYKFQDRHFFHQFWRNEKGQWFTWVYMIGSVTECEGYTYTLTIFSDNTTHKLKYSGSCVPVNKSKEKVAEDGDCLIFLDQTAKRFLVNDLITVDLVISPRHL